MSDISKEVSAFLGEKAAELTSLRAENADLRAALEEKEAEVEIERKAYLVAQEECVVLKRRAEMAEKDAMENGRRLEAMTAARDAEKARADAWQGEAMEYSDFGHGPSCELAKGGDGCNCPAALDAAVGAQDDVPGKKG
jgi:hypothetical protein